MSRLLLGCIVLLAAACSPRSAGPLGMWRDQIVFAGDDGTVLVLGVHRRATATAHVIQVKAWLGRDGRWQAMLFDELTVAPDEAGDLTAALRTWSERPGVAARAWVARRGDELEVRVRAPDREIGLRALKLAELGRATDPEGASVYHAGRGQLWTRDEVHDGWVIVEATPVDQPRRPFVDYGRFAFVAVASRAGGAIALKRSLDRDGFDHAFATAGRVPPRPLAAIVHDGDGDAVELELGDGVGLRLEVRDRDVSFGVAPDGGRLAYRALLLGGDYAGVAFVIEPAP